MFTELFDGYVAILRSMAVGLAVVVLISGVDDLFIDVVYWVRRIWRSFTVYNVHKAMTDRAFKESPERPFAIMVPAWHETGVIGKMAELAATTLDYEDYHVFVGTYPNDADTQREVDEVCARFPNVHKVVCARPGPTSKADCLNNVLDAIFQFEGSANVQFAGFILHDAEDVLSEMELRLFNHLVDRKDLIQLPVYPFERRWHDFTSGHYMDEFAEVHGKDILVREAIAGQVPSAGVGTCFSRRAVMALLADGDGIAFDVQSLTEYYDIGFRLRRKGMSEIFVRMPIGTDPEGGENWKPAVHAASVVCVREYFPNTLASAVRQKARWIVGIVYQGFETHRWTGDVRLNYFLWRDRKGGIVNFVSFLSTLLCLNGVAIWAYERFISGVFHYWPLLVGGWWFSLLLWANLLLMTNRLLQRGYFVGSYYGLTEALLSAPRLVWGNLVNFLANCRAMKQVLTHDSVRRVAWDKTLHDFPVLGEAQRARRPLGQILIEQHALTEAQLAHALSHPQRGLKLGAALVHAGLINTRQLAWAVAVQSGVAWESFDAFEVSPEVRNLIPAEIALHYAVFPLREQDGTVVVASEQMIDPVSIAALGRKLRRPVTYVIAPKGEVTVGLRHFYARHKTEDARGFIETAVLEGDLSRSSADALWAEYVSRQVMFADVLTSLGHLDAAALRSVLLRHEHSGMGLGEFLVQEGIISLAVMREALTLQAKLQSSMRAMFARAGVKGIWADRLEAKAV
jgi:bacteriophage N4 adsorption protein B